MTLLDSDELPSYFEQNWDDLNDYEQYIRDHMSEEEEDFEEQLAMDRLIGGLH